ncbi:hypothetical protein BJ322DRAFT_1123953 [Thelephora terrestris]|uniref:BTB domain-containing protein n=1 Tax=Thelephora terrestris TaxID=56493 RepID=A0A9P6L702_9AGAM|nr:hypothetical protein BJ322DRAFT_1123953 [Thelephora terrestris]
MSTYQFTADDADIVLRASRCDTPREFRVHKIILSLASPVFKDMFSIPQPDSSTTLAESAIPIIDVDDTPSDLELLLRMIYPFGFPPMPTLDAISCAFILLDKYEMQSGLLQTLKSLLVSPEFLKNDPIRVYSIACRWKLQEEADLAAPLTSSFDVVICVREEDVQWMTSVEYHRILTLEKQRQLKSQRVISHTPSTCSGCHSYKSFYIEYRGKLLESFKIDHHTFYDHSKCIIRCFEIVMELKDDGAFLGCGISPGSHLGSFISTLAEKLSSPT